MNQQPQLPEGFTALLDEDADLCAIWNGSTHTQAQIRDKQLAMHLRKLKTFSHAEARAVLLLAPHGTRRNGDELDETLRGAGFRPPPKIMNAEDLMRALPDKGRFLWERWLPAGYLTVSGGGAGEGKTAVIIDIVRRLLAPETMPDGRQVERVGSVLWADTESSQGIFLSRIRKWGLPLSRLILPLADPLGDFRADNMTARCLGCFAPDGAFPAFQASRKGVRRMPT